MCIYMRLLCVQQEHCNGVGGHLASVVQLPTADDPDRRSVQDLAGRIQPAGPFRMNPPHSEWVRPSLRTTGCGSTGTGSTTPTGTSLHLSPATPACSCIRNVSLILWLNIHPSAAGGPFEVLLLFCWSGSVIGLILFQMVGEILYAPQTFPSFASRTRLAEASSSLFAPFSL